MNALNDILSFIDQYDGTAIDEEAKRMLDNDTDLEFICNYIGIDYEEE